MGRLEGKTAIITGAANGIGSETAKLFCEEGCTVAIVDIDEKAGKKLEAEIAETGAEISFYRMDVTNEDDVMSVFEQIIKDFGNVDILVNNAGIVGVNKLIEDITEKEFTQPWEVDVKGLFLCTKHIIPHMKKREKGSIVNLSSITGLVASSGNLLPYHAAKGAVTIMTKNMAINLAPYKIRVNSIHPGTTLTPLICDLGARSEGGLEAYKKRLAAKHPLGLGVPKEVAYAILFMASDEASRITGASLAVDGGFTAQ